MSTCTITCDQAIFTSVRTPMGEGYRIIASSRGLHFREKQAITRCSPSHDALCVPSGDSPDGREARIAVAFYPLPTGRLCVAVSQHAGNEHTGRGGQRVYTHNVVFASEDFERCEFNAFAVARAIVKAGAQSVRLDGPTAISDLELPIDEAAASFRACAAHPALTTPWRCHCLETLLHERSLIIELPNSWQDTAEALIMGVPGPSRAVLSFSAGLRFSVGRCHRLSILHDDHRETWKRIAGKPIEYVNPAVGDEPGAGPSEWLSFVERHWSGDGGPNLARRTSLSFRDGSDEARERIANLYNSIDALPGQDVDLLLRTSGRFLREPEDGVEAAIAAELAVKTQHRLLQRIGSGPWEEVRAHWDLLYALWQSSDEGCVFAWPLIDGALRKASKEDPLDAAETAFDLAGPMPTSAAQFDFEGLIAAVLTALADWLEKDRDGDPVALGRLYEKWRSVRPDSAIVARIGECCDALAGTSR